MKITSCTHSFALLALSFLTIQFASGLSIDSKALANLQPRLDGDAVSPDTSSSSSATCKKKKCKVTKPVPGVAQPTGGAPVITSTPTPAGNATTLAPVNHLSYSRSYKTKCTKKTSAIPSASNSPGGSMPGSGSNRGTGSGSSGGNGTPDSGIGSKSESKPDSSNAGEAANPGSHNVNNDSPGSSPATVCGPQQTVTVTLPPTTVTVTQNAEAGASGASSVDTSANSDGSSNAASHGNGSEGGKGDAQSNPAGPSSAAAEGESSIGSNSGSDTMNFVSTSSGSTGSDGSSNASDNGSQRGLGHAQPHPASPSSAAAEGGSSSGGNSGSGTMNTGSMGLGNSQSGNSASENSASENSASGNPGSSNAGSSSRISDSGSSSSESSGDSSSPYYGNQTISGAASPTSTGNSFTPQQAINTTGSSNSTNATLNVNLNGQFWAGADIGTLMRMEAIPQRVYYDYDGKTVKDPIKTLAEAGVNAMRVTTQRGQCLGPTNFVNNDTTLEKESYYELDLGCIDIQVKTAERSVAQGMRVMLTINQGFNIPAGMEQYSYEQMIDEVQEEAKRQLQPFLDAKIVPDVILLENEGTDGFLFNETATGHTRGKDDGKAPIDQVNKEMCGMVPTGSMASFPQYAGYLKAEIIACNEAIAAAGFSTDTVRYGLHSHGQYVQWKEGVVHGPNTPDQSTLADSAGNGCSNSVIPVNIISQNVSEMLNIMGFSAYADPMRPTDINSESSQRDSLNRTLTTLTQMMGFSEAYGKYESGPFKGEYKLQALGVEYATSYDISETQQEQKETALMWSLVKQFGNVLGMMWWEPWYCNNHWEGGKGALCHMVGNNDVSGIAPDETLKVWGSAARSPWKT